MKEERNQWSVSISHYPLSLDEADSMILDLTVVGLVSIVLFRRYELYHALAREFLILQTLELGLTFFDE